MLRNIFAAALIGPIAGASPLIIVALLSSLFKGPRELATLPGSLFLVIFGAYAVGLVPAIIGGAINGAVQHVLVGKWQRRIAAAFIGFAATFVFLMLTPLGPNLGSRAGGASIFGILGAIAAIASHGFA